jgi:hypothetical protein
MGTRAFLWWSSVDCVTRTASITAVSLNSMLVSASVTKPSHVDHRSDRFAATFRGMTEGIFDKWGPIDVMRRVLDDQKIAGGETMADPRQRRLRLWPWRQQPAAMTTITTPPAVQEVTEKLIELVHFERGVGALYYYFRDESLAAIAQNLCHSRRAAHITECGVDHDIRAQDATLDAWTAVSAIWHSEVWQPGEILATFGFRLIEALRAKSELWSVVVDPRAQFFGLAVTADDTHRHWMVMVTGQKGQEMGGSTATAAR